MGQVGQWRPQPIGACALSYYGDVALGDTIHIPFDTVNTSGVPATLAGSPVVSAYPSNSITQLTAGITLTVDRDGVTGFHTATVVATSGNGYLAETNYALILTAGTVEGSSVVGYVVGGFSIGNRVNHVVDGVWDELAASHVTAGTMGYLENATDATLTLAATELFPGGAIYDNLAAVLEDTDDIGVAGAGLTAIAAVGAVTGAVGSVTGSVGSVVGAVGSIGVGGIGATSFAAGALDAAALATDAVTEIWSKAITELGQAKPSATPAVIDALAALYMVLRNQVTVTASEITFSNDAGTVIFKKALSDDGTTYTEAEAASGP